MSDKSLDARDAKRDIGVELLEAVRSVKAGVIGRVHIAAICPDARHEALVGVEAHDDARFLSKVQEAMTDTCPRVSHGQVMDEAQTLIDRKRRLRS